MVGKDGDEAALQPLPITGYRHLVPRLVNDDFVRVRGADHERCSCQKCRLMPCSRNLERSDQPRSQYQQMIFGLVAAMANVWYMLGPEPGHLFTNPQKINS